MNCFLLAWARTDERYRELIRRVASGALDRVPFIGKEVSLHGYERNRTVAFSVSVEDPMFPDGHTSITDEEFFSFSGVPFRAHHFYKSQSGKHAVEHICAEFKNATLDTFFQTTLGAYNIFALQGARITAFGDFFGRCPVYYFATRDVIGVSNRQSLLQFACTRYAGPAIDETGLSWLLGHSQIWGSQGVFANVRLVEPGNYAMFDLDKMEFTVKSFAWQPWHDFDDLGAPCPAHFDKAVEFLDQIFGAYNDAPVEKFDLSLSGGKDSRVAFAGAMRNGLRDRVRVFTGGPEGSPEIACAEDICNKYGIPQDKQVSKPSDLKLEPYWLGLRYHITRNDLSLTPTGGTRNPTTRMPVPHIGGAGGEYFRGGVGKQFVKHPPVSVEDAALRWEHYHVKSDALALMRPHVSAFHRKWMSDWVHEAVNSGIPLGRLPEVFFLHYRLPFLQGIAVNATGFDLRLEPLMHPQIANISAQGSPETGALERMHFEILKRCDPWLIAHPFVSQTWDPRLEHFAGGKPIALTPYQSDRRSTEQNVRPLPWALFEDNQKFLSEFLLDHSGTPIFDLVDRVALETRLKEPSELIANMSRFNQIMAIVAAQMHFAGLGLVGKDRPRQSGASVLRTNIPGLSLDTKGSTQQIIRKTGPNNRAIDLTLKQTSHEYGLSNVSIEYLESIQAIRFRGELENKGTTSWQVFDDYGEERLSLGIRLFPRPETTKLAELRVSLGRTTVRPGDVVVINQEVPIRKKIPNGCKASVDLVLDHAYWFAQRGATPVELPVLKGDEFDE